MADRRRKRALIVLDCALSAPSAMVRALQHKPLFETSPMWCAKFVSRRSERWNYWANRTHQPSVPFVVPLVHRPIALGQSLWELGQEDEIVRQAAAYDLVYLIKVPSLRLYQRLRALKGPRVVMDFNDGLWLPAFQAYSWADLDAILATAHAVICENEHVANYARQRNPIVVVVPDSPQIETFDQLRHEVKRDPTKIILGWIGSPENVGALYHILEPLEALFARHPNLDLRLVGASASLLPRFENVRHTLQGAYDQNRMVRETLAFDIGLFPMFHNDDGLARGTLKAMIYMSGGAAVAAERWGENLRLIEDGSNGVLAGTQREWLDRLEWLTTHPSERAVIAERGLQTIRSGFTADSVFSKLILAFDHVLAHARESVAR